MGSLGKSLHREGSQQFVEISSRRSNSISQIAHNEEIHPCRKFPLNDKFGKPIHEKKRRGRFVKYGSRQESNSFQIPGKTNPCLIRHSKRKIRSKRSKVENGQLVLKIDPS